MTFLAAWGRASVFLKMLPKFRMAARGQLQIFLWAQKLKVLLKFKMAAADQFQFFVGAIFCGSKNQSEIFHVLQSHSPRFGDVQVIFLRFC